VTTSSSRWRRFGAATVVVASLAGTAACSGGGSSHPSATAPTTDPAAQAALDKAVAQTGAVSSYAFRATQRISGGAAPQVTVVNGRAVRPASTAYTVTVGTKVQEVVKIGPTVYVRIPPATWQRLAKPTATVDPLASLQALLAAAQSAQLSGSTLTAQVPATALAAAQLAPTGATPGASAPVTFTLDGSGRVASVRLALTAKAGATTLSVEETTEFSSFGAVAPVVKP
jgi:hypothetical protein